MSIHLCHSPSTHSRRILLSEKGSLPLIVLDGTHLIKISDLWSNSSLFDVCTELVIKGIEETKVRPLFFCKLLECAIFVPGTEPHNLALDFYSERDWEHSRTTLRNENISLKVYEVPAGYVTLENYLCSEHDGHGTRIRALVPLLMAHSRRMADSFKSVIDINGLCVFVLASAGQRLSALFAISSAKTFLGVNATIVDDENGEEEEEGQTGSETQHGTLMELRVLQLIIDILEKNSEGNLDAESECEELRKVKSHFEDRPDLKSVDFEKHGYFFKPPKVTLFRHR